MQNITAHSNSPISTNTAVKTSSQTPMKKKPNPDTNPEPVCRELHLVVKQNLPYLKHTVDFSVAQGCFRSTLSTFRVYGPSAQCKEKKPAPKSPGWYDRENIGYAESDRGVKYWNTTELGGKLKAPQCGHSAVLKWFKCLLRTTYFGKHCLWE